MDSGASNQSSQQNEPVRHWILGGWLLVGLLFLLGAVTYPIWGLWLQLSKADRLNRSELERRGDRYEAIVGKIFKLPLLDRGPTYFEISQDRDPVSLKSFDRSGSENSFYQLRKEGRLIVAWREPGDRLIVQFVTQDYGHMGTYWLVYTDRPTGFNPGVHGPDDRITPIASNWWAIYDPHQ